MTYFNYLFNTVADLKESLSRLEAELRAKNEEIASLKTEIAFLKGDVFRFEAEQG